MRDANPGVIDAHYFRASSGERYLLWKLDGNAIARPTPIRIQRLADDGVTRMGPVRDLITNDRGWENHVVEAPWIVERGGMFYLFYSANAYDRPAYGWASPARARPGPYTKAANPILTSAGLWDGPGHGSVLVGPSGDWVHVYHGWPAGQAGRNPPGRRVLVDRLDWSGGWPRTLGAPPSRRSRVRDRACEQTR